MEQYAAAQVRIPVGAVLLALAGKASFRLPKTPVPITAQTLVVHLLAYYLGPVQAPLSVVAYLVLGFVGPDFFRFQRPATYGYRLGFLLSAIAESLLYWYSGLWRFTFLQAACVMAVGDALTLMLGAWWLRRYSNDAFRQGVTPFVPGSLVKIAVAALVVSRFPIPFF